MATLRLRLRHTPLWRHGLWLGLALLAGALIGGWPLPQLAVLGGALAVLALLLLILAEPTLGLAAMIVLAPFTPYTRINIDPRLDPGQILLAVWAAAVLLRELMKRRGGGREGGRGREGERAGGGDWETESQTFPLPLSLPPPPALSPSRPPLTPFLLLFLAATALSFFPAHSFTDWASEWVKWVEILILYVAVARERSPRRHAIILGALVFSAAFQGIVGWVEYTRGYGPPEFNIAGTRFYRAFGTFEQPNPYGGYMGLLWPVVAGIALALIDRLRLTLDHFRNRQWSRVNGQLIALAIVVTAIALLAASGVITSGSRGARLGLFAAVAVMALAWVPWPGRGVALAGLMGLAAFALNLVPASLFAQLESFLGEYGTLDARGIYLTNVNFSNVERLAHWQAGLDMMRNNPWLGVGFGNYDAVYGQYRLLYWVNALGHAHNYYINVFAETGVIGFMAYGTLWVAVIALTWHRARRRLPMVALLPNGSWCELIGSVLQSRYVAVGLLGTWVHLTVHHLVDNLYVANTFLLIGVLLGLLQTRPLLLPKFPLISPDDEHH